MFELTAFLLPSSLPTRLGLDPRAERAMKIFTKRSHAQRLFPQRNNMEKHKFSSTLSSKYAKVTCFENSKAFQPQVRIKVQLSTKKILNLFHVAKVTKRIAKNHETNSRRVCTMNFITFTNFALSNPATHSNPKISHFNRFTVPSQLNNCKNTTRKSFFHASALCGCV